MVFVLAETHLPSPPPCSCVRSLVANEVRLQSCFSRQFFLPPPLSSTDLLSLFALLFSLALGLRQRNRPEGQSFPLLVHCPGHCRRSFTSVAPRPADPLLPLLSWHSSTETSQRTSRSSSPTTRPSPSSFLISFACTILMRVIFRSYRRREEKAEKSGRVQGTERWKAELERERGGEDGRAADNRKGKRKTKGKANGRARAGGVSQRKGIEKQKGRTGGRAGNSIGEMRRSRGRKRARMIETRI